MIATGNTTADGAWRRVLLDETQRLIDNTPSEADKTSRLVFLAERVAAFDLGLAKTYLRSAMVLSSLPQDLEDEGRLRRRIVDIAHRIDPHFASSLASVIDDDPARAQARKDVREHLRLLETKKRMVESESPDAHDSSRKAEYPRAAWMNLAALNAGRLEPLASDAIRSYLEISAQFTLQKAYPILAWMIENSTRRLARTDQAAAQLLPLFQAAVVGAELAGRLAIRTSIGGREVRRRAAGFSGSTSDLIVQAGSRDSALQFIRVWVEHNVDDYLKVSDPYFRPQDLDLLKLVQTTKPTCKVFILTSRKQQSVVEQPWAETYRTHWRLNISDQAPPDTEIIVVGTESQGESPIHDRWWLTARGGLRLGTSFNSIGIGKTSEISVLSSDEADRREQQVDQYIFRQKREHVGERLQYGAFTL